MTTRESTMKILHRALNEEQVRLARWLSSSEIDIIIAKVPGVMKAIRSTKLLDDEKDNAAGR